MSRPSEIHLEVANDPVAWASVAEMFREYAGGLEFPLDFQGFDAELANLPGAYAEPRGTLLLARIDGRLAGAVGLRPLETGTCEMKRLYVRPGFRGTGVGRALAQAVVAAAEARGYERMRLDTVPSMVGAIALYRSMGFVDIPSYRYNPIPGAVYLEKRLRPRPSLDGPTGGGSTRGR